MCSKRIRTSKDESSNLRGRTVDVVVGAQQEVFSVHETLIRASSSFFDKAMAGDWKESQQRTIHLPDDDSEIFAVYVHWLYCGTLPVFSDEPGAPARAEYLALVKAYVLGDKMLDFRFQNTAIDGIVEKSQSVAKDGNCWYPNGELIKYAFENTNESAPIRELLVDMYVNWAHAKWIRKWAHCLPQPFLLELAFRLLDRRERPKESREACRYHTRRSDEGNSPEKLPSSTKK
ncbi:hypothetical protein CFD26_108239 [Aspergillus turcosus]|uniref:BTB domain-containing protein n=1 Tax=Aspergillus turcosus TaxID=1245748 RepID=A0A421DD48_9EURO|nr:hypothetical protein CFD26_108239 [Aspergillus turcosus]